ncbi:putative COP9 signalosome complex subunit 5 protein [Helianthus anomalus]
MLNWLGIHMCSSCFVFIFLCELVRNTHVYILLYICVRTVVHLCTYCYTLVCLWVHEVEIGAFRTYPEGCKPSDEPLSEYQTIPLNKIEDFGVHCKLYHSLDVTYFKSSLDCHLLDLLWNKYWVNTLLSSPLLGNGDYVVGQISDLAKKLEQAEGQLSHSRFRPLIAPTQRKKEEESQLAKITRDSAKITVE